MSDRFYAQQAAPRRRNQPVPTYLFRVPHKPFEVTRMSQAPTIGRIVHFTLRQMDVDAILARRQSQQAMAERAGYPFLSHGNEPKVGEVVPMVIVRINSASLASVNGQCHLDSYELYWATSVCEGEGPGTWQWPTKV